MPLRSFLFPDPPRAIPGHRALSVLLRTAHLMTFGTLVGGHVLGVDPTRLVPFLVATIATGAAMIALELATTCAWLFMGKGVSVLLKLLLLALVPVFWEHRVVILMVLVSAAGVTSHMPSRFRHRVLVPLALRKGSGRGAGTPLPSLGAASPRG